VRALTAAKFLLHIGRPYQRMIDKIEILACLSIYLSSESHLNAHHAQPSLDWGVGSDHDHRNFEFPKWSMVKMTILNMTIIPFYYQMVLVKWSKLTDISTISTNFNNKKSRIVEIVMIKFGLTILTMKIF
jgi:hypothetical protein